MKIIFTLISLFFSIFLLIMFYLDYKKIINFRSKLGFFITYLFNFVLIAAYFLWYLNQKTPSELSDSISDQFISKLDEIILIALILVCNFFTKFFFKAFEMNNKIKISNREHASIMSGFFTTIGIIGAICRNFDLVFTVALYLIGNRVAFSISESKDCIQEQNDDTIKRKPSHIYVITVITICIFVLLSNIFSDAFQKYEKYLFIIPTILLGLVILIVIALCIKYPTRVKKEFETMFLNLEKILFEKFH